MASCTPLDGQVGRQLRKRFSVGYEAVEGDGARRDVTLERAAREVGAAAGRLEQAVLDEPALHRAVGAHLAARRVAAAKAHERVGELVVVLELALDGLLSHLRRYGVVDVEQRHRVGARAHAQVLGERAEDVDLAGNEDAARHGAAVDEARLEAELARERRPALVGKGHVLARAADETSPDATRIGEAAQALLDRMLGGGGGGVGHERLPGVCNAAPGTVDPETGDRACSRPAPPRLAQNVTNQTEENVTNHPEGNVGPASR